jgi:transposase-like protein
MTKNKYTAQFKFDRVVESLKTGSVGEIARRYGFGATLLSKWRSEFLEKGYTVFDDKPDQDVVRLQKKVGQLEQLVGKKEIELNLIKNFADFYGSQSGR